MPNNEDEVGDAQKATESNGSGAQRKVGGVGEWPFVLISACAVTALCIFFLQGLSSNNMRKYFLPVQICLLIGVVANAVALIIRGLNSRSRPAHVTLPQTPPLVAAALLAAMGLAFVYEAHSISKDTPPLVWGFVLLGALGLLVGALIALYAGVKKGPP